MANDDCQSDKNSQMESAQTNCPPGLIDLSQAIARLETPDQRRKRAASMLSSLQDRLVSRIERLPDIVVSDGYHVKLLHEARNLFLLGFDYSCVTVCGVTAERIALDLMLASLRVVRSTEGGTEHRLLDGKSNSALESLPIRRVLEYLEDQSLIQNQLGKSFHRLADLRNTYAHGSGQDAEKDADEAVKLLHDIVKGTVSYFKAYEVRPGGIVRKSPNRGS